MDAPKEEVRSSPGLPCCGPRRPPHPRAPIRPTLRRWWAPGFAEQGRVSDRPAQRAHHGCEDECAGIRRRA
eukprot:scaffold1113_cov379-Prasinococcus_capsulatus_cf.AAC.10